MAKVELNQPIVHELINNVKDAESAKCMKKEGKTRLRLRQLPSFFITQIPQA